MIEIREARADEHAEAGAVTADAYREFVPETGDAQWQEYLLHIADVGGRADRTTVLVAIDGASIVGSATLELDGRVEPGDDPPLELGEAHIRMLGVATAARRRGIARALMAACEERAVAAGRTKLSLNTTHRMGAAQQMYEALGYRRGPDRVFPDGFVLLSYSKRLA